MVGLRLEPFKLHWQTIQLAQIVHLVRPVGLSTENLSAKGRPTKEDTATCIVFFGRRANHASPSNKRQHGRKRRIFRPQLTCGAMFCPRGINKEYPGFDHENQHYVPYYRRGKASHSVPAGRKKKEIDNSRGVNESEGSLKVVVVGEEDKERLLVSVMIVPLRAALAQTTNIIKPRGMDHQDLACLK
ncbi:hypothetical protein H112_02879 [Trichophyton rubrum D6]|uniref:Uncharacterized protein n=2 Tax=Trichophyton TaxID=5550 RepID=A0A022W8F5_TRIRU|nr:hypothetical protein H100_02882 [Trichophyton rubrum MR850]EZF43604.1 hypothetical protein H102_02875 [Trichophyton rubrum CBS 100081]EZF54446.1 hypothetical protein H103_02889 [Trichophyton rubrum CBS 288.86]EZF65000.1 hypothetical protein H104_02868 [Trichophyton rubrum CBS 289.86]EZF75472.1 hypothetical protein H105_02896 [Trichophyton soudanense CBS 452.61]EZF86232.1 hypothetical protein H110_02890 [Trichophyton rubrum MR1448]EZF97073.1 hypothetical protein H113_02889 [Trichophyton rub